MNEEQAMSAIRAALSKALSDQKLTQISLDTDLRREGILDSLDGMVFMLEVAELTGAQFPHDRDPVAAELFRVRQLVTYLAPVKSPEGACD